MGGGGYKLSTNLETNGRYHSDWLTMMYPRLKLARNLLTDDGVIFISIDDNEQGNLKKICDEIFGENNLMGNLIQLKGNAQNDAINIQKNHEYILVYSKSKIYKEDKECSLLSVCTEELIPIMKDSKNKYFYKGSGLVTGGEGGTLNSRKNLGYTIYYNQKTKDLIGIMDYDIALAENLNDEEIIYQDRIDLIEKGYLKIRPPKKGNKLGAWTWSIDKFNKEKDNIFITDTLSVVQKKYISKFEIIEYKKRQYFNNVSKSKNIQSILKYATSVGTESLKNIFDDKLFNNPKNISMIKFLVNALDWSKNDNIILDFFSGSATTAHAVMQLNAEDGGKRKHIMVQLPEITDEKSEAHKAGYKNICEIGKERIRRAGEKIKNDESLPLENREKLDIGFKVFKLDTSNIKEWDSEATDLQKSLLASIDNIKEDRTPLDILYEILLKYGLDLNVPIVEKKNFYSIGGGSLLINLDNEINLEVIDSICKEYEDLIKIDENFKTTVVFRDSSFKNDADKTNAIQKLSQFGIKEIRSI